MSKITLTALEQGAEIIRKSALKLPLTPGVYRMLGEKKQVLYVGKAKSLKKRVSSYANTNKLPHRLKRMVAATQKIEIITTPSEAEALLLEATLIQQLKPQYNILLRDDKTLPHILLRKDHEYPQILKHRGEKKIKGNYYGPFSSVTSVNLSLKTLQRAFGLRSCSDSYFKNRKAPCLLYHVKRCSAPCVGKVSKLEYEKLVGDTEAFLNGKGSTLQKKYIGEMQTASKKQNYEIAAFYRDKIQALSHIQSTSEMLEPGFDNADVLAIHSLGGKSCIQVFFFRNKQHYGNVPFFPRHDKEAEEEEILSAFITQFYQENTPPNEIYVNHKLSESSLLTKALHHQHNVKTTFFTPTRGKKHIFLRHAAKNAENALMRHLNEKQQQDQHLENIKKLFHLKKIPQRIEVYDNSHISGDYCYGVMIVATADGFEKKSYRIFKIKGDIAPGDDYAMMREVLRRRFSKKTSLPDLILIDGGKGQLSVALKTLEELKLNIPTVGIAKGKERNAGREKFFMPGKDMFQLPVKNPTLYYLQRLRDEAHRFAITTHRKKRTSTVKASSLDHIEGVGEKRKKLLLQYFGSVRKISGLSVEEIMRVEGINKATAEKIFNFFHPGS